MSYDYIAKVELAMLTKERDELREHLNASVDCKLQLEERLAEREKELENLKERTTCPCLCDDFCLNKSQAETISRLNEENENLSKAYGLLNAELENKQKAFWDANKISSDEFCRVGAELEALKKQYAEIAEITAQKDSRIAELEAAARITINDFDLFYPQELCTALRSESNWLAEHDAEIRKQTF